MADKSGAAAAAEAGGDKIDEALYSRQLYVIGVKEMGRLAKASVLIWGLTGTGVEVAKNVILAGVKRVALYDPEPAALRDLAAQFYLGEADVGKPRAAASVDQLRELNEHVAVDVVQERPAADAAGLGQYTAVVMVDQPEETLTAVNDFCHAAGVRFTATGSACARCARGPGRGRAKSAGPRP